MEFTIRSPSAPVVFWDQRRRTGRVAHVSCRPVNTQSAIFYISTENGVFSGKEMYQVLAVFMVESVSCDPAVLFSFWYKRLQLETNFLTTCKHTFLLSLLHTSSDTSERSKQRKRISLKKRKDFFCQNEARAQLLKSRQRS